MIVIGEKKIVDFIIIGEFFNFHERKRVVFERHWKKNPDFSLKLLTPEKLFILTDSTPY